MDYVLWGQTILSIIWLTKYMYEWLKAKFKHWLLSFKNETKFMYENDYM
jgi:hypothetical protein